MEVNSAQSSLSMSSNSESRKKINPKKFALWISLGSFILVFAGFTSAYIVRRSEGNWDAFPMPTIFYISTFLILLSSVTMWLGIKAFKKRSMSQYNLLMILTLLLGISFTVLQILGFYQLSDENIKVDGNVSGSFFYVIVGMHLLHLIGGILAILISFISTKLKGKKVYSSLGLELAGTYWHFVDFLWIYLFVFLLIYR